MHSPRRKCVNMLVTLYLLYLLFQENKSFGAITICIHPLMYKKPCRGTLTKNIPISQLKMLHVLDARPCCMSILHVHEACLCCMPMLLVHATCPSCLSMLHAHAACPYCMSMRHVHAAHPRCMSVLHVHAVCPY